MPQRTKRQFFDLNYKWRRLGFEALEERRLMAVDAASGTVMMAAEEPGAGAIHPADVGFPRFYSEQELSDYLLQTAVARWQHLFAQQRGGNGLFADTAIPAVNLAAASAGFSGTNVQVAGVDEGDLVKTDGQFLYLLRGQDLLILDARPQTNLQVVSHTRLEGNPLALYLLGDRLTVVSNHFEEQPFVGDVRAAMLPVFYAAPEVKVTVFDVSDRTQPLVVRETWMEGRHIASRMFDERLVLVLQNDFDLPQPEFYPDPEQGEDTNPAENAGDAAKTAFRPWWPSRSGVYESEEDYVARIGSRIASRVLPTYRTADDGPTHFLSEPTQVYRSLATTQWPSFSSIVLLDATGVAEAPLHSASVPMNAAEQVYVSRDSVYLLGQDWQNQQLSTAIHKFHVAGDIVELAATGKVAGIILNQFSVDEHAGHLRIATTDGFGAGNANHVYVLSQQGNRLETVGRLEGLAPGERIFSVRFLGDEAYVVTFRQVDPLFAIDLSDPTQPRLAGELHIPGFSNYLQPVGEHHLLGIGRDVDPMTGRNLGLQVSLFDVSNLSNPQLVERVSIDAGPWVSSEATYDHHAVGYFAESGVLAIPVQGWLDTDGDGMPDSAISALWVFQVDTDSGLTLSGQVEMTGEVRRSLRIDDALYCISTEMVKSTLLADPASELAAVELPASGDLPDIFPPLPDPVVVLPPPIPEIEVVVPPPIPGPEVEPPVPAPGPILPFGGPEITRLGDLPPDEHIPVTVETTINLTTTILTTTSISAAVVPFVPIFGASQADMTSPASTFDESIVPESLRGGPGNSLPANESEKADGDEGPGNTLSPAWFADDANQELDGTQEPGADWTLLLVDALDDLFAANAWE